MLQVGEQLAHACRDAWATEGTRPLSMRPSAAASTPAAQPSPRIRGRRWLLVLASVAIVTTVAGLSLGRRDQETEVVQVNRPAPQAVPPRAAAAAAATELAEPAEVQVSRSLDAGVSGAQQVAPAPKAERAPKRSAQRTPVRSAQRATSGAKPKVDLGL